MAITANATSGLHIWSARYAIQGTVSEMGAFVLHPTTQAIHQLDADSDSDSCLSYLPFLVRLVNSIKYIVRSIFLGAHWFGMETACAMTTSAPRRMAASVR